VDVDVDVKLATPVPIAAITDPWTDIPPFGAEIAVPEPDTESPPVTVTPVDVTDATTVLPMSRLTDDDPLSTVCDPSRAAAIE
jgi:hypothetical protein